jgi:hypothetical protein
MAQTATSLAAVLKDAWTSERIQRQFYNDHPPLERIEQVQATMIGQQAQVPIHKGRSGGYVSTGPAGGSLNPADQQRVDQAVYTMVYHWFQVDLEVSALNQAGGSNVQAVLGAKDLEVEGAVNDLRNQCMRQVATNGDGIVAQCATGGASTTVSLIASPSGTAWGFDAIQRGWLYNGLPVDIGTTADTDVLATGSAIVSYSESSTAPTITIGSSISTTSGTHFVYIANPNSTTAANPELNGLRNIVNTTGAVGGLNPGTAGQEFWSAARRDTTTSVFSLDLVLDLQRAVMQKSAKYMSDVWTGLKQQSAFYSLLQNQVRFQGELNLGAGKTGSGAGGMASGIVWNNLTVCGYPDILDSDWYCLTLSDFVKITGSINTPTWASDLEGDGGKLRWKQGFTDFVDGVVYPFQVGIQRRNTHAGATALTA